MLGWCQELYQKQLRCLPYALVTRRLLDEHLGQYMVVNKIQRMDVSGIQTQVLPVQELLHLQQIVLTSIVVYVVDHATPLLQPLVKMDLL